MKFRNLRLTFSVENVVFHVLSIGLEKMLKPIPSHSHSKNSYELHYISYGFGTLIADGQKYHITPGTFFVTGPGIAHEQISEPDDPMTEYGVYLQIDSQGNGTDSGIVEAFLNCLFWIGAADNGIHDLMKRIIEEAEAHPFGYELMLPALLQQLILMVARLYIEKPGIAESSAFAATNPGDMTYLTIEEAFLYDYRDLTLEKLARQVNLGPRQTERLLQKHYNKTFLQKKTQARMSAACILLQEGSKSIAAVADELGYSSTEHFINAFKKYYHITPGQYRSKIKGSPQIS